MRGRKRDGREMPLIFRSIAKATCNGELKVQKYENQMYKTSKHVEYPKKKFYSQI